MKHRNLFVLSAATALWALAAAGQTPAPPTPPAPEPPPPAAERKKPEVDRSAYVRRFAVGGRVHAMGLGLVRTADSTQNLTAGPTEIKATGEAKSQRASFGVTMQVMLTERIGVGVDLLRRKPGFMEKIETRVGTDIASTATDERKLTTTEEQSRATVWELPVLGRYYMKGRFEEGWRWFLQGGMAVRHTDRVVTFTKVGDTCCEQTPRTPGRRRSAGVVAGAGIQAMDNYGIKVMPEIRYTWWLSRTFDSRAARSARHQVEVGLAITF